MCSQCWDEYGRPAIVNAATRAAAEKVARIYDYSDVGGNAHVVADDWNLSDQTIDWCLSEALAENIHKASEEQLAVEGDALTALRALSLDERASAMAIFEGYIDEHPPQSATGERKL